MNTQMLTLARRARGFTLDALASEVGVSPGLISRWEHGVAVPPSDRVDAFAKALKYPPHLFLRPEKVAGSDSVCFHHRKRKSMPVRLLDAVEAQMHLAQLQVKSLLDDLAVETPFQLMTLDPAEIGSATAVASQLRAYWRMPRGPVSSVIRLIENAGAVVLLRNFGTLKLDGMSCWAKCTPPLFFINSELPVDRRRWTIVHELGHLVMHACPPDGDQEQQAEDFAREFLFPAEETISDLRRLTFQRLPALKHQWRVPMKEIITAGSRRGALPPSKVKSLSVQYSRAGWHTAEPYPLPPEEPELAAEAIRVHLAEGFTYKELADIAMLDQDEFDRTYGGPTDKRLRAV